MSQFAAMPEHVFSYLDDRGMLPLDTGGPKVPELYDNIKNPAHYCVYPVQPIEISRHLGFCLGCATKYVLRAPWKGGVEDCEKAIRYLELERETPQAPFVHHEYDCSRQNIKKLVHYLLHAEGDMLFGDVAICQLDYLDQLASYLFHLDRRFPAKMLHEIAGKMLESLRDLRRILEIRDRQGDIYEGMTGVPINQEDS